MFFHTQRVIRKFFFIQLIIAQLKNKVVIAPPNTQIHTKFDRLYLQSQSDKVSMCNREHVW